MWYILAPTDPQLTQLASERRISVRNSLISNFYPSNGYVATVKTVQQPARGVSCSAPSLKPEEEWQAVPPTLSLSTETSHKATPEQLKTLTAVPSALHKGERGNSKSAKGKKNGKNELNIIFGNDQRIPWSKTLADRSVIRIVATVEAATLFSSSITVPAFFGYYWQVNYADNFTNLAGVFDEYHIAEIEAVVLPQVTEVTQAALDVGTYVTAVDVDDAATPTTVAQVSSYPSSMFGTATTARYHRWKPHYAVATYSGSFTSYSSASGWVDCSSPNVQWYGLKGATPVVNTAQAFRIMSRMTILFRALH